MRKEYDINLTGGSEKMQYYLSLGYLNNEGVAYHSDFDLSLFVLRLTTRHVNG